MGAAAPNPYACCHQNVTTTSPIMTNPATNYDANTPSTTKRKRTATGEDGVCEIPRRSTYNGGKDIPSSVDVIDLTGDEPEASSTKKPKQAPKSKNSSEPAPERRARVFRKHPPKTYLERLGRVRAQRMFVRSHHTNWVNGLPVMEFDIIGTTGNIYKVTVGKEPTCNCPDARKGNQCKHICYILVNALKAPAHLQYQLAFLSTELCEIYQGSPLSREQATPDESENSAGNRKPVEGDCPICFMEFEPATEQITWCRAACGNNIHKICFDKWAATQRENGVRCVYCRSTWQVDNDGVNLDKIKTTGNVNSEGYENVADQLGLSGERDYSTYHQPWVYRGSSFYGQRSRGNYRYY